MDTQDNSFNKFIQALTEKWGDNSRMAGSSGVTVVTVTSEPGSGGRVVARGIADALGYHLFQRDIIQELAESADIDVSMLDGIEKERLSDVEDWVASLANRRYLWPDIYVEQFIKIIRNIGEHGKSVIAGRGANFILPPEERLSIRIVAPQELRIQNISRLLKIPEDEARKRMTAQEAKRRAFVRNCFDADITAPLNYDLVFNTEYVRYESVTKAVQSVLEGSRSSG
jgi:cytidylate kinase